MTPNRTSSYDTFAVEAEARRLRAEATRDALRRLGAWLRRMRASAPARAQAAPKVHQHA